MYIYNYIYVIIDINETVGPFPGLIIGFSGLPHSLRFALLPRQEWRIYSVFHPLFWGGYSGFHHWLVVQFSYIPKIMMLYDVIFHKQANTSFQAWNTWKISACTSQQLGTPNQLYREMSSVLHLNSSPWYTGLSQNRVHRKLTRESDDM